MAERLPSTTEWQVPAYEVHEYRKRASDYCVCVFVLNEGPRLTRQLERMQRVPALPDVVIADGGSRPDELDAEELRDLGVRTLLVKRGVGRLSAQMRMAFAYALVEGYSGIITIDGNDKDDPSAIPRFVEALRAGADHVQGSRFIPGGWHRHTPLDRLLAVRLLHAPLISIASGRRYTDTTNGFRAYSRRLLLDPRVAPFRDVFSRYELHYYLAIRAARLRYSVREVPVGREYPASGPVPTKIGSIGGKLSVLSQVLKASLHMFDPVPPDSARTRGHG